MEGMVGLGIGLGARVPLGDATRRRGDKNELRLKMKTVMAMELRWVGSSTRRGIYISTKPSDVNPEDILRLSAACNHSCHRFPLKDELGDIHKLRLALSHSSFFVSVFAKSQSQSSPIPIPTPFDSELVGFGRAVSDLGLTASIHDVMVSLFLARLQFLRNVLPSSRRMGIGRMIVQRLVRMLTSRDIYDISALCSEEERLFFKECGFGDDVLASTTMMYTKTLSSCLEVDQIVTRAGRKLLVAPPLRNFTPSKTTKS